MKIKWKNDERETEANYMKQKVTHVVLTGQFKTNLLFNDKSFPKECFCLCMMYNWVLREQNYHKKFYHGIDCISCKIQLLRYKFIWITFLLIVPEADSVQIQEMKSTISNLRSLLKECFRQLQEERKQSANLLTQVADLESKVLTYNQVITQLLKQQVQLNNMLLLRKQYKEMKILYSSNSTNIYIDTLDITYGTRKRIKFGDRKWNSSTCIR